MIFLRFDYSKSTPLTDTWSVVVVNRFRKVRKKREEGLLRIIFFSSSFRHSELWLNCSTHTRAHPSGHTADISFSSLFSKTCIFLVIVCAKSVDWSSDSFLHLFTYVFVVSGCLSLSFVRSIGLTICCKSRTHTRSLFLMWFLELFKVDFEQFCSSFSFPSPYQCTFIWIPGVEFG